MKIKLLELFGGIGAPRRALLELGFDVKSIDYVEVDEKAVRSYNSMFDNRQCTQDVRTWNMQPDILVHGSPCQDISIAGKQLGADKDSGTRSSLLYETLRIIRNFGIWKPRVVIWENVRNVISKYMIHNFNGYLKELEELGYVNSFEVVNALDYGLPQNRERVFVVSVLGKKPFNFDEMEKKRLVNISEFLEQNVDERYIVTQESMLRMIEGRFKNPKFKRKIDIIGDYCNTITTRQVRCPNSGVIDIGNGRYRYLTEKECWRLQGFRDCDYDAALKANPSRKGCMNNTLYRQAGNSMPVTVLKEIFRVLLKDVI